MASRQRCEISHCSGPVKNSMNENEILLIFSTNHLLLQKFLEDRLCLKDALAVLLKKKRDIFVSEMTQKKQEIYCNRMLPNQPSKCQNVCELCKNKMVYNPPAHELSQPGGGRKAPEEREIISKTDIMLIFSP